MTKLSTYDQQDEGEYRYGLPIGYGGVSRDIGVNERLG